MLPPGGADFPPLSGLRDPSLHLPPVGLTQDHWTEILSRKQVDAPAEEGAVVLPIPSQSFTQVIAPPWSGQDRESPECPPGVPPRNGKSVSPTNELAGL